MKHLGSQTLQTKRLTLRPFKRTDAKMMFDNWASDERATQYLTWRAHKTLAQTEGLLESWVEAYGQTDYYKWAITLKDQLDEVIGDISVVSYNEGAQACEIGYVLSPNYWGRGITTEALRVVADYLLLEVNFNRLEALHDVNNVGSGKVMTKAGLQYEGTHRQYSLNNQGRVDSARYAILREDLES
ncbi:GNAT family N-acetyltransferase [Aerococcaceae bacterium WGS1372]